MAVKHIVKPINFVISSFLYTILLIIPILVWIIFEPGILNKLKPTIQSEVNKISGSYIFDIGDISLSWNKEFKALNFKSDKIFIQNKYKQNVAHFDKAEFGTDFIKLFKKEPFITNINVNNSVIYLRSKYDIKSRKGNNVNSKLLKYYTENFFSFVSGLNSTLINEINFDEVSFIKPEDDKTTKFIIDSIKFKKEGSNEIIGTVLIDKRPDPVIIVTAKSDTKNIHNVANVEFKDIQTNVLADYFLANNKKIQKLDIAFNSMIKLDSNIIENKSQIPFNITDLKGNIIIDSIFAKELEIDNLNSFGRFNLDDGSVSINRFQLQLNKGEVTGDLELSNLFSKNSFAPNIKANLLASDILLDDLDKYWPIKLAAKARKWIIENVSDGVVKTAKAQINIPSEFLLEVKKWKQNNKETTRPILDKNAIDATINVENTTVNYSKKFEKVTSANAIVTVKNNAIHIESDKAKLINTSLKKSVVDIKNMFEKPLKLSVKSSFDGYASDLSTYLKGVFKDKPKNQIITSLINSSGYASGDVALILPIKKGFDLSDLDLKVNAKLVNIKLPKFIGSADLEKTSGSLIVNNSDIQAVGTTQLNKQVINFDYSGDIKDKTSNCKVNGDIAISDINEFNIAKIPFISKKVNVDLDINKNSKNMSIKGVIDAKNAAINLPVLSFIKEQNTPAIVEFSATKDKQQKLDVEKFSYKSGKSLITGSVKIEKGKITKLSLDNARHKNNNLQLSYLHNSNNIEINFDAKSIDFNDLIFAQLPKSKGKKSKYNIKIIGKAKKILMKKDRSFTDAKIDVDCENSFCQRITINTKLGSSEDDYFAINTIPKTENIRFDLKSNNTGYFLESISGLSNIKDGDLNFAGNYKNSENGVVADGNIKLEDFSIIDTPILAKLFTIASFRGLSDLLNNKGITFKKFSSPIIYKDSIIEIVEAKSAGSAIGITSKGTLDLKNKTIDLKGALIPAHEVNKILGDIPLLGTIIVGKKNEGIIATNYKIQGELKKPKISANPLSMLTPGFLRNIFDIF